MKTIPVHLKERSYRVVIGDACSGAARAAARMRPSRVLVIAARAVARAGHAGRLLAALKRADLPVSVVVLPDGERHKTLATVTRLYRAALKHKMDRRSLVVAMGGGVVTDVAGFFAATYLRGIPFLSVPTTLLGMVDAAIGGKTGVDLPEGKNLVGAFHQPAGVFVDPRFLRTLPPDAWRTGLAEVVKTGVILDAALFRRLERAAARWGAVHVWPAKETEWVIARSVALKARTVSGDEREAMGRGLREILNFGHTAGHALEAACGYRALSHGEAVSIGMAVAGRIAVGMTLWSGAEQARMVALLRRLGLPVRFPPLSRRAARAFWQALAKDKKHAAGAMRFVLPRRIGHVEVRSVPRPLVRAAVAACGGPA